MKGVGMSKNLRAWLVLLALVGITVAAFRLAWTAGRRSLLDDLGMDGYRVVIDRALEPGEGRCIIQVWRDGGWVDVER